MRFLFSATGSWSERERRLLAEFGAGANPETGGGRNPEAGPDAGTEGDRDRVTDGDPTGDAERLATGEVSRADAAQQRKELMQNTWLPRFDQTLQTALASNPSMQKAVQWMNSYLRAGGTYRENRAQEHYRQAVNKYVTDTVNQEMQAQGVNDFRVAVDTSNARTLDAAAKLVGGEAPVPAPAPAPLPEPPPMPPPGPAPAPSPMPPPGPGVPPPVPPGGENPPPPTPTPEPQNPQLPQQPTQLPGDQPLQQPANPALRTQVPDGPAVTPPEGQQPQPEAPVSGERALAAAKAKMDNAKTPAEGIAALAEYVGVMFQQLNAAFENIGKALDPKGEANKDPARLALSKRVAESKDPPAKTLIDARDAAKRNGDGLDAMIKEAEKVQPQTPEQQNTLRDARRDLANARKEQAAAEKLLGEVQQANAALQRDLGPQLTALTQRSGGKVTYEASLDTNGDLAIRLTGLDAMTALRMGVQPKDGVITLSIPAFREAAAKLNNPAPAPRRPA